MKQNALRDLRKSWQKDRLSPWMQAMALAYREASKELFKTDKANADWVAPAR